MVELKVGDTVKVIAQDRDIPYYTIGIIGKVTSINDDCDCYELCNDWCYGREQLVKGHMEFISDEQ
jgi:hypothetical protein